MLVVELPQKPQGSATEYGYVRSSDVENYGPILKSLAAQLPQDSVALVAVVPSSAMAWHTLTVPPLPPSRMPAAITSLLEEHLLEDPNDTHMVWTEAGAEVAKTGGALVLAVCSKSWLRQALAPLQAQGRVVSRIVPECSPATQGHPKLWLSGSPEWVSALYCDGRGVMVLPQPPWPNQLAASLSHPDLELLCEPGLAAWAQSHWAREPKLVSPSQRLVLACETDWDLARGEWAQGRKERWSRTFCEFASQWWQTPKWRAARWGMLALLAINLLGLNWLAWQQTLALDSSRQAMVGILTQSFPSVKVVVDPPLQMARELEAAKRAKGSPGPGDLEVMLSRLGQVLPQGTQIHNLQFTPGELQWQANLTSSEWMQSSQATLQSLGYELRPDGTHWVMRRMGRP
jgi:general secretion pathway protein L